MIKKICLLSCHNLYESKRYFTQKLAEALNRRGIETPILSWDYGPTPEDIVSQIQQHQPDLTCSFNQLPTQSNGRYFWDSLKLPHWTILVDPAFYDLELMGSPYSILSCVDRSDCDLLRSYRFEKVFFFPHAIERELISDVDFATKPIDVLMLGTCYDPDQLRAQWQKKYSPEICDALDDAIERVLSDKSTSFFRALLQSLTMQGIDPHEVEFNLLAYYVDTYTRGIDRLQLIRSIKGAQVHVFGSTCWREGEVVSDWSHYLSKQANVQVYPAVNFPDALTLMKMSKICLNSMPFFKNGTHERVFATLACGALPVTSDNLWMEENFSDEKELLLYQFSALEQVNERIMAILNTPLRWHEMVKAGQDKVRLHHTWDQRVDLLLDALPSILENIRKL